MVWGTCRLGIGEHHQQRDAEDELNEYLSSQYLLFIINYYNVTALNLTI